MAQSQPAWSDYTGRETERHPYRERSDDDPEHYIDFHQLSLNDRNRPASLTSDSTYLSSSIDSSSRGPGLRQLSSAAESVDEGDGFLSSSNVAQELRNLANLRRLSLDVSNNHNVDPDVPLQAYDLAPAHHKSAGADDDALIGDSLYWVPADIHPEIAPQEWQSFVQRRDTQFDMLETAAGPFRAPSLKRGLSRSKSLLSRQVTEQQADGYRDAAPDLARRRSQARSPVAVQGFARLGESSLQRQKSGGSIEEAAAKSSSPQEDEPILVPPPGQILRRAARTGKGRGSYRKPVAKSTAPQPETTETEPVISPGALESEPVYLQQATNSSLARPQQSTVDEKTDAQASPMHRQKSNHRQAQILGPASSNYEVFDGAKQMGASTASLYLNQREDETRVQEQQQHKERKRPSTADDFHIKAPLVQPVAPLARHASVIVGDQSKHAEHDMRQPLAVPSPPQQQQQQQISPAPTPTATSTGQDKEIHVAAESSPIAQELKQDISRPGIKRELSAASVTRAVMSGAAVPTSVTHTPANLAVLGPSARAQISPEKRQAAVDEGPSKKSGWGKLFGNEDRTKAKQAKPASAVIQAGVLGANAATGAKIKRVTSATDDISKESATTNLFTSIFGGGKKKEKEATSQPEQAYASKIMTVPARSSQSGHAPGTVAPRPPLHEPHFYTRFPIQLERAIYRMAHLKLGNSRRPLLHQVLLSNFMYGYLALVGAGQQREASQQPQPLPQPASPPTTPGTPPRPKGEQSEGDATRGRGERRSDAEAQRATSSMQGMQSLSASTAHLYDPAKTGKRKSPPQLLQQAVVNGYAHNAGATVTAEGAPPSKNARPGPPRRESSMNSYRPAGS